MFGHRDVNYTSCPGNGLYGRFGTLRSEAQGFNDGGWKEHLWVFQGAGGASALGTVVKSAHRTGRFTATQLTKGLVLQEGGDAYGYATPFGKQWGASWGRPTRGASQDGDRRIQPFENGTAALEGGKTRFVTPDFRDVSPERVFFLEIQDLFAAGVTKGWGSGSNRTFQPNSNNLRDAMIVFIYRAMGEWMHSHAHCRRGRLLTVDRAASACRVRPQASRSTSSPCSSLSRASWGGSRTGGR